MTMRLAIEAPGAATVNKGTGRARRMPLPVPDAAVAEPPIGAGIPADDVGAAETVHPGHAGPHEAFALPMGGSAGDVHGHGLVRRGACRNDQRNVRRAIGAGGRVDGHCGGTRRNAVRCSRSGERGGRRIEFDLKQKKDKQ